MVKTPTSLYQFWVLLKHFLSTKSDIDTSFINQSPNRQLSFYGLFLKIEIVNKNNHDYTTWINLFTNYLNASSQFLKNQSFNCAQCLIINN